MNVVGTWLGVPHRLSCIKSTFIPKATRLEKTRRCCGCIVDVMLTLLSKQYRRRVVNSFKPRSPSTADTVTNLNEQEGVVFVATALLATDPNSWCDVASCNGTNPNIEGVASPYYVNSWIEICNAIYPAPIYMACYQTVGSLFCLSYRIEKCVLQTLIFQ